MTSVDCPTIVGLKFDQRSIEGIERIKEIREISSALLIAMPVGVFANIFLGNKISEISFSIFSTDWERFSKAMAGIPAIVRREIEKEVDYQVLDHFSNPQQRAFWEAVGKGCAIP